MKRKCADYRKVLEFAPQEAAAMQAAERLPGEIQAEDERQQAEALGKLKEMGNSVLGMFGLSLDNFHVQKDPNSGSNSMSFGK